MKFVIVFLAVLGLALAAPRLHNSINDDLRPAFNDLLANIDLVRLAELLPQIAQTQDGKEFLAYVQGPEFRAAIDAVKAEPTTEKLMSYLESNGLEDVREVIRLIGEALGINPNPRAIIGTKNFTDLIGEVLTTVDVMGLVETYLHLNIYDEAFRNLEFFLDSEFEAAYFRLKADPAIKVVGDRLRSEGVEVDVITEFIEWVFAWGD